MISISYKPTSISNDEAMKKNAASEQVRSLLERVSSDIDYRLLTSKDRDMLQSEGFAHDLISNLVFLTQRIKGSCRHSLGETQYRDVQMCGYNFAAFDPSIYATANIKKHLNNLSGGKCFYCETNLSASNSGNVYHFRPPAIITENSETLRSPYSSMAYQLENLVYACYSCAEINKGDQFPVVGNRFPNCDIKTEDRILIDPYIDSPRNYIRFNPLNGKAYPFDLICDFYQSHSGFSTKSVESVIWSNPRLIPSQKNSHEVIISATSSDSSFQRWVNGISIDRYKGYQTIEKLALNRPQLIKARMIQSRLLRFEFERRLLASTNATSKSITEDKKQAEINDLLKIDIAQHQYTSLAIDAANTWFGELNADSQNKIDWDFVYSDELTTSSNSKTKNSVSTPLTTSSSELDADSIPFSNTENNSVRKPKKRSFIATHSKSAANKHLGKNTHSEKDTGKNITPFIKTASAKITVNNLVNIPSWLKSSLIYIVFESELTLEGKRRIVFLHQKDKLYGGGFSEKCVFESINWNNDIENVIKVRSPRNTWETSFSELAESRPLEIIDLFSDNELWAEGNYNAVSS